MESSIAKFLLRQAACERLPIFESIQVELSSISGVSLPEKRFLSDTFFLQHTSFCLTEAFFIYHIFEFRSSLQQHACVVNVFNRSWQRQFE